MSRQSRLTPLARVRAHEKWVADEMKRFDRQVESEAEGFDPILGEPLPPRCDECVSFDCENCPARYEEDEDQCGID